MALRSRYRTAETPTPPNIQPEIKIDGAEPETVTSISAELPPEAEPAVGIVDAAEYPEPNEAAEALKRQLEHLRTSEELQRRHAQQMAQQHARPPTREQLLQAWRANGGDPDDIAYLEAHPLMIDRHDVTVVAAEEAAQQGFARGTPEHREQTKALFDRHLASLQAPQAQAAQPTTAFFAPPPPARSPAAPDRSAIVSAPVSRRDAGTREPTSPRSVKLTVEEQQIAAASGISDVQYAQNKLRMLRERASGQRE